MFKLLKNSLFIFCLITTTVAFGRSTDYFKYTLGHMVKNKCNTLCQREIITQELGHSVFLLVKSIIAEIHYQITQQNKQITQKNTKKVWSNK